MYNARKRKSQPPQVVRNFVVETLRQMGVIGLSVALCLILSVNRWPGMSVQNVGPNWFVIWVVVWSLKHTRFQGAIAGLAMGLLQDALTASSPTHGLGLAIVGALSAHVYQGVLRFWTIDWLVVPVWVVAMTLMAELWVASQWVLREGQWMFSALVSSLVAIAQRQWQPLLISAGLSGGWSLVWLWLFRAWQATHTKRKKRYRVN